MIYFSAIPFLFAPGRKQQSYARCHPLLFQNCTCRRCGYYGQWLFYYFMFIGIAKYGHVYFESCD
jgi:hypothetical protein